jgi:methylated-DNA-[protein]-cysteine S-methyltransferase
MKFPAATVYTRHTSPLGDLVLAANATHLMGLWFQGQKHQPAMSGWREVSQHPVLTPARTQLTQYFNRQRHSFEVPIDFSGGTAFQQLVWQALQSIAPGSTCSYKTLAQRIGRALAVRAVGAAVGQNPLGIIVPCHRVIGASGDLTGYAGGLERKLALLQLENAWGQESAAKLS